MHRGSFPKVLLYVFSVKPIAFPSKIVTVTPPKINECPLKRDHFKKQMSSSNHQFSGDMLVFRDATTEIAKKKIREDLATNWADMLCQNVWGQDEKTAQTLQGALNIEKQLLAVRAKHSHLQDMSDSTVFSELMMS